MAPRLSDVWLRLFQLSEAFHARGPTHDEQLAAVTAELATMPPELQQQSYERLQNLNRLLAHLIESRE